MTTARQDIREFVGNIRHKKQGTSIGSKFETKNRMSSEIEKKKHKKGVTKEKEKVLTTAMQDIGKVGGNISRNNNFLNKGTKIAARR